MCDQSPNNYGKQQTNTPSTPSLFLSLFPCPLLPLLPPALLPLLVFLGSLSRDELKQNPLDPASGNILSVLLLRPFSLFRSRRPFRVFSRFLVLE